MASVTRSLPSAPICPTQSVTSVEYSVRPRTDSYILSTKPSLVPPALDRNSPELRHRRWTSSTVAHRAPGAQAARVDTTPEDVLVHGPDHGARLLEACAVAEAPRDGPDVGERVVAAVARARRVRHVAVTEHAGEADVLVLELRVLAATGVIDHRARGVDPVEAQAPTDDLRNGLLGRGRRGNPVGTQHGHANGPGVEAPRMHADDVIV